jgi:hypothetical protein
MFQHSKHHLPTHFIEPNRGVGFKQFFFGIPEVVNHLCLLSTNYFKVVHAVHCSDKLQTIY